LSIVIALRGPVDMFAFIDWYCAKVLPYSIALGVAQPAIRAACVNVRPG
jgi:hypothetical protein